MVSRKVNLAAFYAYIILEQLSLAMGGTFCLTYILDRFGIGMLVGYGLTLAATAAAGALVGPFLMRAAGIKRTLIVVQVINGAAFVVLGTTSPDKGIVLLTAALLGLAYGPLLGADKVLFSECVDDGHHGRYNAWLFNILSLIQVVAPLVVGLLAANDAFSSAFWLSGSLLVASLVPLALYREDGMSFESRADLRPAEALRAYSGEYAFRSDAFRAMMNIVGYEGWSGVFMPLMLLSGGGDVQRMGWVISLGTVASLAVRHLVGGRFDRHGKVDIHHLPAFMWGAAWAAEIALVAHAVPLAILRGVGMTVESAATTPMSAQQTSNIARAGDLQYPALLGSAGALGMVFPYALLGLVAWAAGPGAESRTVLLIASLPLVGIGPLLALVLNRQSRHPLFGGQPGDDA